jgi:threonylcarbamoyladenosine tRNA methylthiotransferase MtaB
VEPQEFGQDLVEAIARNGRVCRHFHVPLQSGSDAVLRRMNRGYLAADYRLLATKLAAAFPEAGIGADVIAGFPGETGEEFAETVRLVTELPLAYLHVFPFSPRPGTPAESMPGQVPAGVREERSGILRDLSSRKALEWGQRQVGRTLPCLVESTRDRGTGMLRGVSDSYLKVLLEGPDALANTIVPVTVVRAGKGRVHGRLAS